MGFKALKGIKTISEIAQENAVHPVQVSMWTQELQGRLPELFERANAADPERESRERNLVWPERRVGQLLIEKEYHAIR